MNKVVEIDFRVELKLLRVLTSRATHPAFVLPKARRHIYRTHLKDGNNSPVVPVFHHVTVH